jgi:hypothetical protein
VRELLLRNNCARCDRSKNMLVRHVKVLKRLKFIAINIQLMLGGMTAQVRQKQTFTYEEISMCFQRIMMKV